VRIDTLELDEYCTSAILRRLVGRRGDTTHQATRLSPRDAEILRLHWSLSPFVRNLAAHIAWHPRQARTLVESRVSEVAGELPGSIDASATALLQGRTKDFTRFVVFEPATTPDTPPNRLIAWILSESFGIITAAIRSMPGMEGDLRLFLAEQAALLDSAMRTGPIAEILRLSGGRQRPGTNSLRAAAKARIEMYGLALRAYLLLEDVEALRARALVELLQQSILDPLLPFQRLELATALAVTDALEAEGAGTAFISPILRGSGVVSTVGPFEVVWQPSLGKRPQAAATDLGERLEAILLRTVGMATSSSRPDVAVRERSTHEVLSLFECKWFGDSRAVTAVIPDGCAQLARYARTCSQSNPISTIRLLRHSGLIVADCGSLQAVPPGGPVCFLDFPGLMNGDLKKWARRLLAHRSRGQAKPKKTESQMAG
jgi:hypothetical protein